MNPHVVGLPRSKPALELYDVYETVPKLFVIASDMNRTVFNILKIDRFGNEELGAQEDHTDYSHVQIKMVVDTLRGAFTDKDQYFRHMTTGYGILGFVRFTKGYNLVMITKRAKVAQLGPHAIYEIRDTEVRPLAPREKAGTFSDDEQRYRTLFTSVETQRDFFFSYTYDLSHSLQYNCQRQARQRTQDPRFAQYDDMYVYNSFLLNDFQKELSECNSRWVLPVIHGSLSQKSVDVDGRRLRILLIARRSRYFAGTRFLKRGISEDGNVANHIETEQICYDSSSLALCGTLGLYSSFIQLRGSVPTYWYQPRLVEQNRLRPPIKLGRGDPWNRATKLHFAHLFASYGTPIVYLDLLKQKEKTPRESQLGKEIGCIIESINSKLPPDDRIRLIQWDFRHSSRIPEKVNNEMASISEEVLSLTGMFRTGGAGSSCTEQKGVVRSNCVDCLDRTNLAQFFVGKSALLQQMQYLGVGAEACGASLADQVTMMDGLLELYLKMGDNIALQYGGSKAVTLGLFNRGWSSWDLATSVVRYCNNRFWDNKKQESLNIFLGNYTTYVTKDEQEATKEAAEATPSAAAANDGLSFARGHSEDAASRDAGDLRALGQKLAFQRPIRFVLSTENAMCPLRSTTGLQDTRGGGGFAAAAAAAGSGSTGAAATPSGQPLALDSLALSASGGGGGGGVGGGSIASSSSNMPYSLPGHLRADSRGMSTSSFSSLNQALGREKDHDYPSSPAAAPPSAPPGAGGGGGGGAERRVIDLWDIENDHYLHLQGSTLHKPTFCSPPLSLPAKWWEPPLAMFRARLLTTDTPPRESLSATLRGGSSLFKCYMLLHQSKAASPLGRSFGLYQRALSAARAGAASGGGGAESATPSPECAPLSFGSSNAVGCAPPPAAADLAGSAGEEENAPLALSASSGGVAAAATPPPPPPPPAGGGAVAADAGFGDGELRVVAPVGDAALSSYYPTTDYATMAAYSFGEFQDKVREADGGGDDVVTLGALWEDTPTLRFVEGLQKQVEGKCTAETPHLWPVGGAEEEEAPIADNVQVPPENLERYEAYAQALVYFEQTALWDLTWASRLKEVRASRYYRAKTEQELRDSWHVANTVRELVAATAPVDATRLCALDAELRRKHEFAPRSLSRYVSYASAAEELAASAFSDLGGGGGGGGSTAEHLSESCVSDSTPRAAATAAGGDFPRGRQQQQQQPQQQPPSPPPPYPRQLTHAEAAAEGEMAARYAEYVRRPVQIQEDLNALEAAALQHGRYFAEQDSGPAVSELNTALRAFLERPLPDAKLEEAMRRLAAKIRRGVDLEARVRSVRASESHLARVRPPGLSSEFVPEMFPATFLSRQAIECVLDNVEGLRLSPSTLLSDANPRQRVVELLDLLLAGGVFHPILHTDADHAAPLRFTDGLHIYRFLDNEPMRVLNSHKLGRGRGVGISVMPPPDPVACSQVLLKKAMAVFRAYEDGADHNVLTMFIQSPRFQEFQEMACVLTSLNLSALETNREKTSFWVNIYNTLHIHAQFVVGGAFPVHQTVFLCTSAYVVGGYVCSLDAIHNGILRGNRRAPSSQRHLVTHRLFRPFPQGDPRLKLVVKHADNRVHFALLRLMEECSALEPAGSGGGGGGGGGTGSDAHAPAGAVGPSATSQGRPHLSVNTSEGSPRSVTAATPSPSARGAASTLLQHLHQGHFSSRHTDTTDTEMTHSEDSSDDGEYPSDKLASRSFTPILEGLFAVSKRTAAKPATTVVLDPDLLDAQLKDCAAQKLTLGVHVTADPESRVLRLPDVFFLFPEDFGESADEKVEHLLPLMGSHRRKIARFCQHQYFVRPSSARSFAL